MMAADKVTLTKNFSIYLQMVHLFVFSPFLSDGKILSRVMMAKGEMLAVVAQMTRLV